MLSRGDQVVAVASMNFDPVVAQAAEMLRTGRPITKQEITWVLINLDSLRNI